MILPPRRSRTAALAAAPLLLAAACGSSENGSSDPGERAAGALRIVSTVAPITSIAANIAGDKADIIGIVPEGTNSHTFEPPPQAAAVMEDADIVFVNGLQLEEPTFELAEANAPDDSWHPEYDAAAWVRFNLRAHHLQAQTVKVRNQEAGALWVAVEAIVEAKGLPERTIPALCDAALGLRLRRSGYERSSGVAGKTATRDLAALASAGLLVAHGETRGRQYRGGEALRRLRADIRAGRSAIRDPYPDSTPMARFVS